MVTLKIAHVREQGEDMVIVPLDASFEHKPAHAQNSVVKELQARSVGAGLKGSVVAVWDGGGGTMKFIAPRNWHQFFKSVNLSWVAANVNRELSW